MSTDPYEYRGWRDTVVGTAVVFITLPLLALDLLHVIAPFSIDYLLYTLGVSPRWAMILTVLVYPFGVAAVIELIWPRRGRGSKGVDP
ncbi:hypothetical protein [Aliiroseovarius halocynthiae]|uniref:Uncharacterized protein n=1 Tax=Aliiroseovarius halocynthiae TaxID=985055 RepID=A0A545SUA4_9RHOB|nr:hypothetical protein [Aliiroseovarius halocynthiae]TQV68538.1 hypothetical protein FIL88_02835 [Aliiroseovarius halocynthiae]